MFILYKQLVTMLNSTYPGCLCGIRSPCRLSFSSQSGTDRDSSASFQYRIEEITVKRIVTASILTSLIAGSAAMAGTPPHWISDRARDQQGNNSQRDQGRNNDRNHGRDYSRNSDHRDTGRDERRYARDPHPTWGQNDRRFNDRDRRDYDHRSDRYGNRYDSRYDHRDYRPDRYWRGEYQRPSGWYSHRWSRGERLPREYYGRPYIVYGYSDYGLYAPPRGYSWVRVDSDVVLTALATGLVLDVVYNQFY